MAGSAFAWPDHPDLSAQRPSLIEQALAHGAQQMIPEDPVDVGSFSDFIARRNPSLLRFEHVPRLVNVAQRVATGELTRVIVCLPPRYFKSEIFARLLPAYNLRIHPKQDVALTSYGADLAWDWSDEARAHFTADGGILLPSTGAKKLWRTTARGGMWAYGVGGGFLGRGYHLGIVDDPSDPEKAVSPVYQKRFRSWFPGKFLSRQEPGARIVVVMQRLGTEDPIDFLFRREVGDKVEAAPQYWHVVMCDELKSSEPLGRWGGPQGLPETCTLEPDPREEGEPLAPSRFSREEVVRAQRSAGPLVTSAQRQQRPMRPTGDFWQRKWFRTYQTLPADAYNGGKDWDTAYGEDPKNSATAHIESYRGPGKENEFPIYIHDVDWDWREFPELVEWMRDQTGPHYVEAKATGKSAVQALSKVEIAAEEIAVKGNKLERASAVQGVVASRRVFVREEIVDLLMTGEIQGLLRVTAESLLAGSSGTDVNDVFVQALWRHLGLGAGKPRKEGWFT